MWSDKLGQAIQQAAGEQCPNGYKVETHNGADFEALQTAVNQGIDSHLEAVQFAEFKGDYGRRGFNFTPDTLPVLVRRLMEDGNDDAQSLASSICSTLEIELV